MKPEQCENCGANAFEEEVDAYVCPYCDTRIPRRKDGWEENFREVCRNFREEVTVKPVPPFAKRRRNKWVALLLCFFLGFYGGHQFYEGKVGMGFLYFFTLGLFGIGWLIDLIRILCKPSFYYV